MQASARQIGQVRAFNRDYTHRFGVLREAMLYSPYLLTEVRVLYELAQRRHRLGVSRANAQPRLGGCGASTSAVPDAGFALSCFACTAGRSAVIHTARSQAL